MLFIIESLVKSKSVDNKSINSTNLVFGKSLRFYTASLTHASPRLTQAPMEPSATPRAGAPCTAPRATASMCPLARPPRRRRRHRRRARRPRRPRRRHSHHHPCRMSSRASCRTWVLPSLSSCCLGCAFTFDSLGSARSRRARPRRPRRPPWPRHTRAARCSARRWHRVGLRGSAGLRARSSARSPLTASRGKRPIERCPHRALDGPPRAAAAAARRPAVAA